MSDTRDYTVVSVASDEGSVVVFRCIDNETSARVLIAADRRPAQDIVEALGVLSEDITIEAADWQITGAWK